MNKNKSTGGKDGMGILVSACVIIMTALRIFHDQRLYTLQSIRYNGYKRWLIYFEELILFLVK